MLQTLIIALPGMASLIVCIRRGPEQALLSVYLPALLLLPSCRWPISGQLSFGDTALLPIAAFLVLGSSSKWRWSSIALLVIGNVILIVVAEGMAVGFKMAVNTTIRVSCSIFLPYFAAKQTLQQRDYMIRFAQRIVVLLAIVAIVSVYEFRMGRDLFVVPLLRLFPDYDYPGGLLRGGFMRIVGPFPHSILTGIMMAAGFRIARWLDVTGNWPQRMRLLPIRTVRFCEICALAGSVMSLSVGPAIGAAGGIVAISICQARNRKRALVVFILSVIVLGIPVYQKLMTFISIDPLQAEHGLQEDSAYRHKLMTLYLPLIEERPAWGWGRYDIPVLQGMKSIDNAYLLIGLASGMYELGLFVLLVIWVPTRLLARGLHTPRDDPTSPLALCLFSTYVIFAISMGTVWLGGQNEQLFLLIAGWSDALLRRAAGEPEHAIVQSERLPQYRFQRVMA